MPTDNLRDPSNNHYDKGVASIKGRVFRAGILLSDLAVGSIYFTQTPPAGTILRSISLSSMVSGAVETYLINDTNKNVVVGATTATIKGYNLDNTLESLATAPILQVASITNGELIPVNFSETPTATAQKASSGTADLGLRGTYDNSHIGLFRFDIKSAGTKLNIVWVWEEI